MVRKKVSFFDVIIVGAGPSGLSFARALADTGLRICIVEKQSVKTLAAPPLDGRDIALTHDSLALMETLGMLRHIPANERSPIREAKVFSGTSSYFLGFDTKNTSKKALGVLVPNNEIRRAAYLSVRDFSNVIVRDNAEVRSVATSEAEGIVELISGEVLSASLVVAADSRFSKLRDAMNIGSAKTEFGRVAIVCRMEHSKPHESVAQECFFDAWTLAILPLQGQKSSIVVTLPSDEAEAVMSLSAAQFNARIMENLGDRLGAMKLTGQRHSYPLVAVFADTFSAQRFVLMGDAAVGMHPVTAHGYNLGLSGASILAGKMREALSLGLDIGSKSVTDAYARTHRRNSAFLYYGTNALVGIYTDRRKAALALRSAGLKVANHFPAFKRYVTRQLTGKAA